MGDPGNFELFPDVEPLLEILRACGCTVGLVSNTDRELAPFAAELGISVDFALASRAHGRRKPAPRSSRPHSRSGARRPSWP